MKLILLILLSFNFSWAQEYQGEYSSPWNFNLGLSGGYSSNVANFEGSPADSFLQISPNIDFVKNIAQNSYIDLNANGFLRNFADKEVNDQFRVMTYEGRGTLGFYLSDVFEVGGTVNGTSFWGREVDFNNAGLGRDSRFYTLEGLAFIKIHNNYGYIDLRAGSEILRALTPVFDEAGNSFNNDYNAPKFRVGYQSNFNGNFNGSLAYIFQKNEYSEQRSRLFNGGISPNFDTPFANELRHTIEASFNIYRLNTQFTYLRLIDEIAGAETRDAYQTIVSLPLSLSESISVTPEVSWSPEYYDNFVGDIINNPNAIEKREDNNYSFAIEATAYWGWFTPIVRYQHTTLDSNYNIINFKEDLFSAGFRINL